MRARIRARDSALAERVGSPERQPQRPPRLCLCALPAFSSGLTLNGFLTNAERIAAHRCRLFDMKKDVKTIQRL